VSVDKFLGDFKGFRNKLEYAKKHVTDFGGTWQVKTDSFSTFIESPVGGNPPGLIDLRNAIAHGAPVPTGDLRLDDVTFFRRVACEYLEQLYVSFGDAKGMSQ
jgi:hypothetical protein